MSEYTLSVVQICPDQYKDSANALAEAAGYGPNNLSVKLTDTHGSVWWGCHAWWIPEVFVAQTRSEDTEVQFILDQVITSTRETMDGHWKEVLDDLGLSVYNDTI